MGYTPIQTIADKVATGAFFARQIAGFARLRMQAGDGFARQGPRLVTCSSGYVDGHIVRLQLPLQPAHAQAAWRRARGQLLVDY